MNGNMRSVCVLVPINSWIWNEVENVWGTEIQFEFECKEVEIKSTEIQIIYKKIIEFDCQQEKLVKTNFKCVKVL